MTAVAVSGKIKIVLKQVDRATDSFFAKAILSSKLQILHDQFARFVLGYYFIN